MALIKEKLPDNAWETEAQALMEVEVDRDRPEHSDALAAKLLALDLENPEGVIARLYRDHDMLSVTLWKAIRKQFPSEDRSAALKRLRRLLTAKPDAKSTEELRVLAARIERQLDAARVDAATDDETSDPRGRRLLALATLFHRYGQSKLVAKYLSLIGSGIAARTLIDEGNLYADEKLFGEAAKAYEAAWTQDHRSAVALYLLGWAESQSGKGEDGRQKMELALSVPLADGESRRDLAKALDRLHRNVEAAQQRQWVLRLAIPHDAAIVQTLGDIGDAAAEKPGAAGAAVAWQRFSAEILLTNSVFLIEPRYYLHWPVAAHAARVRELLGDGKTAEAIEELHRAEAVEPTNLQLALDLDADLRKHGAVNEADALYRRMLERHEALCRDFPRTATFHNDLAWLAANLDRDLDKALAHAQRAVELEPQAPGILDTLAEVQFRRGSKNEAVRLAQRCLEMEPSGEHFHKQLARFEATSK